MTDKCYWIWLQRCLGQGARFIEVLEEFGSAEKLYSSNIIDWKMSQSLTSKQVDALLKYDLDDAKRIVAECEKYGYKIITYEDERYPDKLRNISNPPAVIYVRGEFESFDSKIVIGVVGTRKASTYSLKAAEVMSRGMALCGAVIISGGALGVDSAAHQGAIKANAKTYAVLGNGFRSDYLKSNAKLRDDIIKTGGALISEYPPSESANKHNFPMRNRIISALSDGILVVEAGVKSGSLITASHAAEQGKDIFAIPASIFDKNFQGTNKLIFDGAYVAVSPYSVLAHYSEKGKGIDLSKVQTPYELLNEIKNSANTKREKQLSFDNIMQDRAERVKIQSNAEGLNGDELAVYNTLSESYNGIDDIIIESGLPPQKVLVALTMLEMKGVAESASGKRYKKK